MTASVKNDSRGFSRAFIILALPFIILVVVYVVYRMFIIADPVVTGIEAFELLPAETTVRLSAENVRSIDIAIYQNGSKIDVLNDAPETGEKAYNLDINTKELGLKDGRAIVTIIAGAGIYKKVQYDIESVIDTVPPSLEVFGAPSVIQPGVGGFAVLRAAGEDAVFVKLVDKGGTGTGDITFNAFKMVSGKGTESESLSEPTGEAGRSNRRNNSDYYVFFPASYNIRAGSTYYAVATDRAGNQSVRALPTRVQMKKYSTSSISIDDSFMTKVVTPLLNEIHIPDMAGAFRKINEEWRQRSLEDLMAISRKTEPEMLWQGRFLQMKNSKVMATYGDKRTYIYKGEQISKSVHLGYDLASVSNAKVEAANSGVVRFAGDLSIYGNTVIIDHGLGLMSLYGHLSSITVQEGQAVKKGEIIARTGESGLAGGDHLHFGVLMHGYEISPLYWWDPHWIRTHVQAFLPK